MPGSKRFILPTWTIRSECIFATLGQRQTFNQRGFPGGFFRQHMLARFKALLIAAGDMERIGRGDDDRFDFRIAEEEARRISGMPARGSKKAYHLLPQIIRGGVVADRR